LRIMKKLFILTLSCLFISGCSDHENFPEMRNCTQGIIIQDPELKHHGCYQNSFWVEILTSNTLGVDVHMPSFYPGGEGPAISYRNVIEMPFPEEIKNNVTIDSLIGEVIYFKYRFPEEGEIKSIRNYESIEVY